LGLKSEIRRRRDGTELLINGKPVPPILAYVRPQFVPDFRDAGIHIYTSPLSLKPLTPNRFWVGAGHYDFDEADSLIEHYIRADPKSLIIPRIAMGYAEADWWPHQHPEELVVLSDGSRPRMEADGLGRACSQHSFASAKWRSEASQAVKALVEHLERRFPDKILGYHVGGGLCTEWVSWNVHSQARLEDYSQPMQEAFANWLQARGIEFDGSPIPSPRERMRASWITFRDPGEDQIAVEYSRFFSEAVSDTLLQLCHAAKQKTGGEKLVGVFYGYIWTHGETLCPQRAGHLCVSKVLSSPYLDFIASPYHYDFRGLGGVNFPQTLADEVLRHGKLYLNEVDTKTYRASKSLNWMKQIRQPRTAELSLELLKRDFSYALAKGIGMWWMDLFDEGWYHDPFLTRGLRRLQKIALEVLEAPKRSQATEIGVVLDEDSFYYQKPVANLNSPLLACQRQSELSRIGAPFDELLHRNLPEKYKMYIFLNLFYLDRGEREQIRSITRRGGRGSLWVYCPGFIDPTGVSTDRVSNLTGIRIQLLDQEMPLVVSTYPKDDPILDGVPGGTRYGSEVDATYLRSALSYPPKRSIGPIFYAEDANAISLGDIEGTDEVGLAVKNGKDHISLYSAAPCVPATILRNLARQLDVHIYLDTGDLVYANGSFLAIYSLTSGVKRIHLRERGDVRELFQDQKVGEDLDHFSWKMRRHTTSMFLIR